MADELIQRRSLGLAGAKLVAQGAEKHARANGWNVVIVVVDEAARLTLFHRMDGVGNASIDVALGKARHAAHYRRATKQQQEAIAGGENLIPIVIPHAMPIEGGLPVIVGGECVGAVGVSGVTAAQDGEIAKAGIDALMASIG